MNLNVLKIDGTDSGKQVVLDDAVFGIEPNDHAIYLDVIQYLAHQRHGNAKSKDRSEVADATGESVLVLRGSKGLRSPLELRRVSLGAH